MTFTFHVKECNQDLYAQSLEGIVLEGTESAKELLLRYVTVIMSVHPRGHLVLWV